jgi:hydroxymethylglutaryl-CoA synthase
MDTPVGVDAIGVYVPKLFVDLTGEWARARAPALAGGDIAKLVGKVTDGIGVRKMAVVDAHEDCATLAAMAAKRAIDAAHIDPRDIDYLAVGTETTVDQSKSVAAYILGMLERHYGVSLAHVGTPQVQFACVGATYALEAAVARIRSGESTKPYALVLASDISKYPLCTAGEYTQGAGAVALLVCADPRILVLEPRLVGTVTRDERDFFRPNWSAAAVVDGKYSIDVYLDCMEGALSDYVGRVERARGAGGIYDAAAHFLFHVPFPRMAEYAALRMFGRLWLDDPAARSTLEREVPTDLARKDFERSLAKSQLFRDAFAAKVARSLTLARDIGNAYSASLYLALVSLLEETRDQHLSCHRVVFGSYGSGASAKVFSGIIAPRYAEMVAGLRTHKDLRSEEEGGSRVGLTMAEYERLHELCDSELDLGDGIASKIRDGIALTASDVAALRAALARPQWRVAPRGRSVRSPRNEFALERLGTSSTPDRTDVGYRYYAWVGA